MMEHMSDKVDRIDAFLKQKFPGEDWITKMVASKNDNVSTCAMSFHWKR